MRARSTMDTGGLDRQRQQQQQQQHLFLHIRTAQAGAR
jgi:hypothetical protein